MDKKRLREIALFRELTDEEWEHIIAIMEKKLYAEGDTIFREEERGGCLYIISKGKVKITKGIREGEEETLGTLSAGMYFGGISLVDGKKHSASIKALTDAEFFIIHKDDFDQIAQENPFCGLKILKALILSLASFLRSMDAKFIDLVHYISLD